MRIAKFTVSSSSSNSSTDFPDVVTLCHVKKRIMFINSESYKKNSNKHARNLLHGTFLTKMLVFGVIAYYWEIKTMTYKEKLEFLRSEDIKARFLLYGRSPFVLNCMKYWTGFYWHPYVNEPKEIGGGR